MLKGLERGHSGSLEDAADLCEDTVLPFEDWVQVLESLCDELQFLFEVALCFLDISEPLFCLSIFADLLLEVSDLLSALGRLSLEIIASLLSYLELLRLDLELGHRHCHSELREQEL